MDITPTDSDPVDYSEKTFRTLLKKLMERPEDFNAVDLRAALNHLFIPDILHPAQIGAFLSALHVNHLERRPGSLAAAASVLRDRALKAAVQNDDNDFVVDIVGTGGDGHNLFNVSTTAGVVAAGAGARVIKVRASSLTSIMILISRPVQHGSRASTSSSGSADLLEALDCRFTAPTLGDHIPLARIPFTFVLAPHYHPALACIAPYRKALPFRTIFNLLGPLLNPASPKGMVLGVAEPELGYPFASSVSDAGVERAFIVCGAERLDEISCAGPTHVWEVDQGNITEKTLNPSDFGLPSYPLTAVAGGGPQENAETFRKLLTSGDHLPEHLVPIMDWVAMNASALLVVAGVAHNLSEGARLAKESITSGRAWEALKIFRETGQQAGSVGDNSCTTMVLTGLDILFY